MAISLTSLIAGPVIFVTLTVLGVPFPLLRALWVLGVDFRPMVGSALADIPTLLFALRHLLTDAIVTQLCSSSTSRSKPCHG